MRNHRVLVSGDSLPMHFALGTGTRCVTIFNCTSPWEIFDYGVQRQITSPLLAEFFFKRGMDARATGAISITTDARRVRDRADEGARSNGARVGRGGHHRFS